MIQNNEIFFSIMSNLETHYHLKLDFQKWTNIQEASDKFTPPNTKRTISCKAWSSPVEYPRSNHEYIMKIFHFPVP